MYFKSCWPWFYPTHMFPNTVQPFTYADSTSSLLVDNDNDFFFCVVYYDRRGILCRIFLQPHAHYPSGQNTVLRSRDELRTTLLPPSLLCIVPICQLSVRSMKYDVALYVSYTPTYVVPSTVSSIEASEASYRTANTVSRTYPNSVQYRTHRTNMKKTSARIPT